MATVPGLPPLPASFVIPSVVLLAEDLVDLVIGQGVQQWGIFLDGAPVVVADSVVTFDYKQDWSVSTYPLEEGAFESYDKVNNPFDVRLRFACGGSVEKRQAFLQSLASIGPSLELFDAVTPDAIYTSVNVTHYDYRQTATNGVGLIQADVWLEEIRVTATADFSSTQSPDGAAPVSGGNVQTQTPTANQVSRIPDVQ